MPLHAARASGISQMQKARRQLPWGRSPDCPWARPHLRSAHAQHKGYGVHYVGLARAVWADDGGERPAGRQAQATIGQGNANGSD